MDARFDRRDTGAQDLGDLLRRETLELAQDDRGSLLGGQLGDRLPDGAESLLMLGRLRRIRAGLEIELVKRSGCPAACDLVQSSACHDSVEPGAYGAVVAKARQRSPRADEGLLGGILRVGARAEHPQG